MKWTFGFYIIFMIWNRANFGSFCSVIFSSTNILFLKSGKSVKDAEKITTFPFGSLTFALIDPIVVIHASNCCSLFFFEFCLFVCLLLNNNCSKVIVFEKFENSECHQTKNNNLWPLIYSSYIFFVYVHGWVTPPPSSYQIGHFVLVSK